MCELQASDLLKDVARIAGINIANAFLEQERGIPLEYKAYNRVPPPGEGTKQALTAYGDHVLAGLQQWWREGGAEKEFSQEAQVLRQRRPAAVPRAYDLALLPAHAPSLC